MRFATAVIVPVLLFSPAAFAQRMIRAVGDASLSVKPDQAKVSVGVVTMAPTAQEAASQNAAQLETVLGALRQVLGATGDVKTVSYSIAPNYIYNQGQPPKLNGYTATNTVEATTDDLSLVGKLIDAASQSGANNIGGLRFGIKDDEGVKGQVLAAAAKQARTHAEAIASGLGARVGAVLSAQEGAVYRILPAENRVGVTTPTPTPIEPGLVQVQATVTVDVELVQ